MVAFGGMEEEGRLGLAVCNRNTDWSGCLPTIVSGLLWTARGKQSGSNGLAENQIV